MKRHEREKGSRQEKKGRRLGTGLIMYVPERCNESKMQLCPKLWRGKKEESRALPDWLALRKKK